jgi:hypothetical protein
MNDLLKNVVDARRLFRKGRKVMALASMCALASLSLAPLISAGASSTVMAITPVPNIPCCGGGGPSWGVDAVTVVNSTFLSTIKSHVGSPTIVGQYLDAGSGQLLTASEATYLHGQGVSIVLIFSPNNGNLSGGTTASTEAATAVTEAQAVGANPNMGIAIYRDVEQGYTINSAYINQWNSSLSAAGYTTGFYENSYSGQFEGAFCGASSSTISNSYLYSSELHSGSSYLKSAAPTTYNPYYVSCESAAQMSGWQYLTGDSLPGGSIDVDEYAQVGLF